jgi:probable rRNA maturation factor
MPDIVFQIDEPYNNQVEPDLIEKAVQTTLQRFPKIEAHTVALVITASETVRQLNHRYRGLDSPTDVLSFENTPDPNFPDMDQGHLGDVIIAYPVAQAQARATGHTPMEELILLAVHGTLHLLGFDHDTPAGKNKMWTAQNQIMAELGLDHIQPTEN